MELDISGADVRTPTATAQLFDSFAEVYQRLAQNLEWFKRCQLEDGVEGEPIALLTTMYDQAITAMHVMRDVAARARAHADKIGRLIGAKPALVGTQAGGGYTDARAQ